MNGKEFKEVKPGRDFGESVIKAPVVVAKKASKGSGSIFKKLKSTGSGALGGIGKGAGFVYGKSKVGLVKVGTGTKFVAKAVGNKTVKVKNNVK